MDRRIRLIAAARAGDLEGIKALVEGQNLSEMHLHNALYMAAQNGQVTVARYLLEQGSPMWTAPLEAARSRQRSLEMLILFEEYGWDVDDPGAGGGSILREVVKHPVDYAFLSWLLLKFTPSDWISEVVLNEAADASTADLFDFLLDHGVRITNGTPLRVAVLSNHPDSEIIPMIEHLLRLGFDVDDSTSSVSEDVDTALLSTVRYKYLNRARFLLDHGANPFHKKAGTPSPYELAVERGFTEFIEICPPQE